MNKAPVSWNKPETVCDGYSIRRSKCGRFEIRTNRVVDGVRLFVDGHFKSLCDTITEAKFQANVIADPNWDKE